MDSLINDPGDVHSAEERAAMLTAMRQVSLAFYMKAANIGCHPFIEFCGLMNEYIKMCQQAHEKGIDFTNANAHSGVALPMRSFEAAYIGEKLGCIFGPSLQDPDNLRAFIEKADLVGPIKSLFQSSPER